MASKNGNGEVPVDPEADSSDEYLIQLKNQIDKFDQLYTSLVDQIKRCAETDRQKAEDVFKEFFALTKSSTIPPAALSGVLSACNQAMANLLNSTQRLKELLQEVGKTKTSLEDAYDLASGGGSGNQQSPMGVFDRRKALQS